MPATVEADATPRVATAEQADISAWLKLAAEVEPLFGPLVGEPTFLAALRRNIARGTAFCVREGDGPAGAALLGGLLFSPHPEAHPLLYRLGWLAVSARARRRGIGRRLVEHALRLVTPPAEIAVITFGEENWEGQPARRFYESLGFHPAELAPDGPGGGSRQLFRKTL